MYIVYDEITGAERIIKELKGRERGKTNDFSVLRKVRHRSIPEMYDAFEDEGAIYVVMELVEGNTLREELSQEKPTECEVMGYLLDVLDALNHMHSLESGGIFHGDLKPDNIIIREGRAVLIDFGSTGGGSGSPGFCAPEILAGFSPSASSDIYSAGQLLYYCFTGKYKKVFEERPRGIDKGIYRIIERAVKRLPSERYSNVAEMMLDVRRWIDLNPEHGSAAERPSIICFPGNPHISCEAASVLARSKKTLIVDLGILSPGIDMLMGKRVLDGSSYEYCLDSDIREGHGIIRGRGRKPDILPCIGNYDIYEENLGNAIEIIMKMNMDVYECIVVTCSDFPYDSIFQEAIFLCDYTILSIAMGPYDIRKYNTMLLHLSRRQGLNIQRIRYMGYGHEGNSMDERIAVSSSVAGWTGTVPYEKARGWLHREGRAYLPNQKGRTYKFLYRTFKEMEVI